MSLGMQMQLSATQSIFKYLLPSDDEFFRKLYAAKALPECKGEPAAIDSEAVSDAVSDGGAGEGAAGDRETDPTVQKKPMQEEPAAVESNSSIPSVNTENAGSVEDDPDQVKAEKKKEENKKRGLIIGLCAALAVIFVICVAFFVLPHGNEDNDDKTNTAESETAQAADSSAESGGEGEETSEEDTTAATAATLSSELFEYTLEIDGVVYQFPCETSEFTDNGWVVYNSNYENMYVAGRDEDYINLENETTGHWITLRLYNPSGNAVEWRDCEVSGISCYFNSESRQPEILLPGGLDLSTVTKDDLVEAYGDPTDYYESTYYSNYTYEEDPSDYSYDHYVEFYIESEESQESGDASGIIMENCSKSEEATVTNEDVPEYLAEYTAPTELGDDDLSGIVEIDGDLYQMPCPVTEFLNNGWELASEDVGKAVFSGGTKSVTLVRENEELSVSVYNAALYQTIVENCVLWDIYLYPEDVESVQLPCGITLDMTEDEVVECLSGASSSYDKAEYSSYTYYSMDDYNFDVNIAINRQTYTVGYISIYASGLYLVY